MIGGPLGVDATGEGLVLRALGMALDPAGSSTAPLGFVSHVHAASTEASWNTGTARPGRVFASTETVSLRRSLAPGDPTPWAPIAWGESVELPLDRTFGSGTARISLARAGHVLGAAQLVVDHAGGRLVYTGDWSPDRDGTHEPGERVACDELVVTSTFGLPIFRFDPLTDAMAALLAWCAAQLAADFRPVVVAQSPGPAQSIARALVTAGLAVEAEDGVLRVCAAYEAAGCRIGDVRAPSPKPDRAAVFLISPDARARGRVARVRSTVAYASGWSRLDAAVDQKRADAAFAIADHADCDALVALVLSTGAARVHVTRGDALGFARVLRARGVPANVLDLPAIDDRAAS